MISHKYLAMLKGGSSSPKGQSGLVDPIAESRCRGATRLKEIFAEGDEFRLLHRAILNITMS
jgi:hypothetical protein